MLPLRKTKLIAIFITFIFFTSGSIFGQKAANYSVGKFWTNKYEHFSFWMKDDKPTEITYAYGKHDKEIKLNYLGKGVYEGTNCFKISFPDNRIFYVIPIGVTLKILGADKKYGKTFSWEYEGPIEGRGTFCEVCAEDEKEAMKIINNYYLK
jgi:hypothetical protein